jgi:hypothetical protein
MKSFGGFVCLCGKDLLYLYFKYLKMNIEYKKDGIVLKDGTFISLEHINEMCNTVKLKKLNLVLLKMGWSGRGGKVFEQRALPLEKALRVKELLLDKEVYFGEIWGKHSEVCGTMCEKTFNIEKDSKKIKTFLKEFPSGIDYDHSFIETFMESEEERIEYEEEENGDVQALLDELKSLLYGF